MTAPRHAGPELRFAANGDAILTLKTPLPPEILALSPDEQEKFCQHVSAQLSAALHNEFFRDASRKAVEELLGQSSRPRRDDAEEGR